MRKMREANKLYDIGSEQRTGLVAMCEWLEHRYPTGKWTLVEIGTYIGESAVIFSRYFKRVITIDPWEPIFMKSVASDKNVDVSDIENALLDNIRWLSSIQFIKAPSILAAQSFEPRSVDVVYIDGWHRVIPAALDIVTWLPKIKFGGFIAGHDYSTMHYNEVIPAVRYVLSSPDQVFPDSSWLKQVERFPNRSSQ
jgi:hypothetical protein